MLTLKKVVKEIVCKAIPKIERGLVASDKEVVFRTLRDAMPVIHERYFELGRILRDRPREHDTSAIEVLKQMAAAAIKAVTDLGDPHSLPCLADPNAQVNTPAPGEDQPNYDEVEHVKWAPLKDMPPLGMLSEDERERSLQVREARQRADKKRKSRPVQPAPQTGKATEAPGETTGPGQPLPPAGDDVNLVA
jgi:hypothetical protein